MVTGILVGLSTLAGMALGVVGSIMTFYLVLKWRMQVESKQPPTMPKADRKADEAAQSHSQDFADAINEWINGAPEDSKGNK